MSVYCVPYPTSSPTKHTGNSGKSASEMDPLRMITILRRSSLFFTAANNQTINPPKLVQVPHLQKQATDDYALRITSLQACRLAITGSFNEQRKVYSLAPWSACPRATSLSLPCLLRSATAPEVPEKVVYYFYILTAS